jgi:hypothetical protein
MRSKQEYVFEITDKGKTSPRKVGLKSMQRDGIDYEFGIIFDINMNHCATAEKDRTGIFKHLGAFQIEKETGEKLKAWAESGEELMYSGEPHEKVAFAKACANLGVTAKESMSELSELLVGVAPLGELERSIAKLLDERK